MEDGKHLSKIGRPAVVPGEKHTKEKIFEAAIDLFAEHGYERTSVRQIALAVDLTESAVYRHYQSKESILEAILDFADAFTYTPLPVEDDLGIKNQVSIFRGLMSPLPEIIMSEPRIAKIIRIVYSEMYHNEKIGRYFRKEYFEKADNYIADLFTRCIEKGTVRSCDPRALARIFNSFRSDWLFWTFLINPDGPGDAEKILTDMEDYIRFFEVLLVPGTE